MLGQAGWIFGMKEEIHACPDNEPSGVWRIVIQKSAKVQTSCVGVCAK
jgi:hypothetical protein